MILLVSFVAKSASAIIISGLKDAKAYEWVQLLGGRNFWLAPSSPRHVAGRVEGSLVQARIVKALFALAQFLPLVNAKGVTPSAAARLFITFDGGRLLRSARNDFQKNTFAPIFI